MKHFLTDQQLKAIEEDTATVIAARRNDPELPAALVDMIATTIIQGWQAQALPETQSEVSDDLTVKASRLPNGTHQIVAASIGKTKRLAAQALSRKLARFY